MSVSVMKISADKDAIRLALSEPLTEAGSITAYLPLFGPAQNDCPLYSAPVPAGASEITLPRTSEGSDLMYCRFGLNAEGRQIPGKIYVESVLNPLRDFPYPVTDSKKGCQITDAEDAKNLGVRHSALNVNEGDFLLPEPVEGNTIEYEFNGRTFYFNKEQVEKQDARIKNLSDIGVVITLILLNSHNWEQPISPEFWSVIKHPDYPDNDPEALISAFNLRTPEGLAYYSAFVAFLTDRYTRPDGKYGNAYGMIVGNEVNCGYVWCNAGLQTLEDYAAEYTAAVRMTWQTAASLYGKMRVYLSFDHVWTDALLNETHYMKYYGSRSVMEVLNRLCLSEGQVPWNIAFHPYPQDLRFPDFWNDTDATPEDDSKIITFKNLEVLARFTYDPAFLCNGERRRIILSEQGFNSNWTVESEVLQAAAYGFAYKKVMSIPEIDSFILHAHRDNMYEFGLSLGLCRRKRDSNEIEGPKPIYYVFKAIDQKDDKGVYHWERY